MTGECHLPACVVPAVMFGADFISLGLFVMVWIWYPREINGIMNARGYEDISNSFCTVLVEGQFDDVYIPVQ